MSDRSAGSTPSRWEPVTTRLLLLGLVPHDAHVSTWVHPAVRDRIVGTRTAVAPDVHPDACVYVYLSRSDNDCYGHWTFKADTNAQRAHATRFSFTTSAPAEALAWLAQCPGPNAPFTPTQPED
jgi:hypothetical protein